MGTFDGIVIEDLREQLKDAKAHIKKLENALWIIRHTSTSENFPDAKLALNNINKLADFALTEE